MNTKNPRKTALISGVSGQDGAYLARFLLSQGYEVYGSSRDAQSSSFINLKRLGIQAQVQTISIVLTDFRSVYQALKHCQPDEIYNLAGQSSVGLSFQQPIETYESITLGVLNLLEAIRFIEKPIRLYNAGSSECFGDTDGEPANEETPLKPRSPYATAKASAYWAVANYREAYQLNCCTGLLFNHESPLRPKHFVTQKIINSACEIAKRRKNSFELGNIEITRDWGWAPEYVEAMWRMLQLEESEDFVIATGVSHSLEEFCHIAFSFFGLNYRDYLRVNEQLYRPSDVRFGRGDPAKAKRILGWSAQSNLEAIIKYMIEAECRAESGDNLL